MSDEEEESHIDKIKNMLRDVTPHTVSKVIFGISFLIVIGLYLGLAFTSDHTIKYRLMIALMVFVFINCISMWQLFCAPAKCEPNNWLVGFIIFLVTSISLTFALYFAEDSKSTLGISISGSICYFITLGCGYKLVQD